MRAPENDSVWLWSGSADEKTSNVISLACIFQSTRLETFKSLLQKEFADAHVQSLSIADVTTAVNRDEDSIQFSDSEIRSALETMMDANQLMVSDDRVFLI